MAKIIIDLEPKSVQEYGQLAPHFRPGSPALGFFRQLRRDTMRDFTVELAPYDIHAARDELLAEVEQHAEAMASFPAWGARLRALVEQATRPKIPSASQP